jgi:hypothetical protein
MEIENQKYKVYVQTALLYYEKQKIKEIFETYNTRLTTIDYKMNILLNDINKLNQIQQTNDEHTKINELIDLIRENINFNNIKEDIINKCDNINQINNDIHKTVDNKSLDVTFIKSICEEKPLGTKDKQIIQGDLFLSSSSDETNDDKKEADKTDEDKLKRDAYNAKRRERRLQKKNQSKD